MIDLLPTIDRILAAYGEPLTLTSGGSTYTLQGLCVPMDSGTINTYFDANESVGLIRPALSLFCPGDVSQVPVTDDVFDYPAMTRLDGGTLFTVRKVQRFRVSAITIVILALCD